MTDNEAKEIRLEVVLGAGDFQEFNVWFSRSSRLLLSVVSFVLLFAVLYAVSNDRSAGRLALIAGGSALITVILWYTTRSGILRKSKSAFQSDPVARQVQTYRLTEEGIEHRSEGGEGNVQWAEIQKIAESPNLFLFFISSNQALILPKRAFGAEEARFRQLVREHMDHGRVKLREPSKI